MSRRIATLLAFALLAGCSDETRVNPAPVRSAPADASIPPTDAGVDVAAEASVVPEAGPRKREILHRNPFGSPQAASNLMFDGDFEWSGMGSGMWAGFSNQGEVDLVLETGGLCRSGLRCVALDRSYDLYGYGTRASHSAAKASMWARVPGSDCGVVSAYVTSLMSIVISTFTPQLLAETEAPDATGWCRYSVVLPQKDDGVGLYITATVEEGETVIVDEVVIASADGLSPLKLDPKPMPEDVRGRMERNLAAHRRNRWFGVRSEPPEVR